MKLLFTIIALAVTTAGAFCQGTLQFNAVKLVSNPAETVPAGKVWKVTNVYIGQVPKFTASSGSGSCTGSCNGGSTRWTSFTVAACPSQSEFNGGQQVQVDGSPINYNSSSPLWLPAGTTLQGNTFNCNPSSAGFYNGTVNGTTYTCHCPATSSPYSVVSIIEFNVIP